MRKDPLRIKRLSAGHYQCRDYPMIFIDFVSAAENRSWGGEAVDSWLIVVDDRTESAASTLRDAKEKLVDWVIPDWEAGVFKSANGDDVGYTHFPDRPITYRRIRSGHYQCHDYPTVSIMHCRPAQPSAPRIWQIVITDGDELSELGENTLAARWGTLREAKEEILRLRALDQWGLEDVIQRHISVIEKVDAPRKPFIEGIIKGAYWLRLPHTHGRDIDLLCDVVDEHLRLRDSDSVISLSVNPSLPQAERLMTCTCGSELSRDSDEPEFHCATCGKNFTSAGDECLFPFGQLEAHLAVTR